LGKETDPGVDIPSYRLRGKKLNDNVYECISRYYNHKTSVKLSVVGTRKLRKGRWINENTCGNVVFVKF
jgi:hypothetical protein